MQFDEEFYLRAKERAQPWLFQLPGVLGVGLGPKIVAGKRTREAAVQIFVANKRSTAELPAGEVIPARIDEIPTDVIEGSFLEAASGSAFTGRTLWTCPAKEESHSLWRVRGDDYEREQTKAFHG